jgi:hypothetical protein
MRQVVLRDEIDPDTGEPITTCRLEYVEDIDDFDISDVLGDRKRETGAASLRAGDFLSQCLANGDWHDSGGLKKLAAAAGISERTLKRAAQDLNVEHDRRGFPSSTWWRLPQSGHALSLTHGPTDGAGQSSALASTEQTSRANQQGDTDPGPASPTAAPTNSPEGAGGDRDHARRLSTPRLSVSLPDG